MQFILLVFWTCALLDISMGWIYGSLVPRQRMSFAAYDGTAVPYTMTVSISIVILAFFFKPEPDPM